MKAYTTVFQLYDSRSYEKKEEDDDEKKDKKKEKHSMFDSLKAFFKKR